jgi:hypothetical protein
VNSNRTSISFYKPSPALISHVLQLVQWSLHKPANGHVCAFSKLEHHSRPSKTTQDCPRVVPSQSFKRAYGDSDQPSWRAKRSRLGTCTIPLLCALGRRGGLKRTSTGHVPSLLFQRRSRKRRKIMPKQATRRWSGPRSPQIDHSTRTGTPETVSMLV